MARGTQHRKRRPTANAQPVAVSPVAARKKQKPKTPQWQEELFFARIRGHAKWAFVVLAGVFSLGFVFLGIGSGSNGISDALQSAFHFGNAGSGSSISGLEKKTVQHPKDAQAWRDLATAYEQKQRPQDAVNALESYVALQPKDESALAELAGQYTNLATGYATDYTNAESAAGAASLPSALVAPAATTALGKAFTNPGLLQDPLGSAVQSLAQTNLQTALSNYQSAQQNAEKTYKKIVVLNPSDATSQVQLGQAAQAAGDNAAAIKAFTTFLKLAPNDPLAAQVKQALKQLQPAPATAKSTSK